MEVLFMVPGQPISKGRPRATKAGRLYTPGGTEVYENLVRMAYCKKYGGIEPTTDTLQLVCTFTFPIPQSAKRKKVPDKIKEGDYYFQRPDLDNLLKSVLDGLNKVAFVDDSQIVMTIARKVYGAIPGAYISLKTIAPQPTIDPEVFEE